jgi:GNAT superfamily N-acetyltransferase
LRSSGDRNYIDRMESIPMDPSRYACATSLLARAFFDDPGVTYLFPDAAAREAQIAWLYGRLVRMLAPLGSSYLWTSTGGGPESVGAGAPAREERAPAAVALWAPPRSRLEPLAVLRAGLFEAPTRIGARATARVLESLIYMERARARWMRGRPHWYLDHLAVEPALQGRGLGSHALARMLAAQADVDGLPCMLFTSKETNLPFYRGHGFDLVEEGMLGGRDGVMIWAMVRSRGVAAHRPT